MASKSKVNVKGPKTKTKKLKEVKAPAEIKRELVYIDTEKVNINASHLQNAVQFSVFKSDSDPSIIPDNIKKLTASCMVKDVCFAQLHTLLENTKANRLYYKLKVLSKGEVRELQRINLLKPQERVKWIRLAKRYKLLPPYINENAVKKDTAEFIIDIEKLTPSLMYVYLSVIRHIREDPALPRAVLFFVNNLRMNFYAAYAFASKLTIDCTGHHIINVQRYYGEFSQKYDEKLGASVSVVNSPSLLDGPKLSLCYPIGLQRLVNNPKKYDERTVTKGYIRFGCANKIEGISNINTQVTFQELFDKNIKAVIMSKTDTEARKYLDKFNEYRSKIKYVEASK